MNCDTLDTYNDYPTNFQASLDAYDMNFYRLRLIQNAPSLFVSESATCNVEVHRHMPVQQTDQLALCEESCTKSTIVVSTLDELRSVLEVESATSLDKRILLTGHGSASKRRLKEVRASRQSKLRKIATLNMDNVFESGPNTYQHHSSSELVELHENLFVHVPTAVHQISNHTAFLGFGSRDEKEEYAQRRAFHELLHWLVSLPKAAWY